MARVTARIVDTTNDAVLGAIKIDGTASERSNLESTVAKAVLEQLLSVRTIADHDVTANITTLAVLPFKHLNAGTEDSQSSVQTLSNTITQEVATQVSMMDSITLASPNESTVWSVAGSIQQLGELVRVTVRVTNKNSNAVVHAFKVDGSASDVVSLTEQIVSALTETLKSTTLTDTGTTAQNTRPLFRFAGDQL